MLAAALLAAGCGGSRPAAAPVPPPPSPGAATAPAPKGPAPLPPGVRPVEPGTYVERGIASWYGPPFHGRRAADGEIFNMNEMVAAHRTLPFGSIVRVTNLDNGMKTEVRIIDRGPFVRGRIIDLSLAAARAIDMVRSGIAPVRVELVASPAPQNGLYAVQVGAFQERANALRLRSRLAARYPVTLERFIAPGGLFYRVRVGREPTEGAAERLADRLAREDGFQTFVVRLDGIQ